MGINPDTDFCPRDYGRLYPDIIAANVAPWEHYQNFGQYEGRYTPPVYPYPNPTPPQNAIWVEGHDFSLTGAPLAILELYQGLNVDGVVFASPFDGALRELCPHPYLHGASSAYLRHAPDLLDEMMGRLRAAYQAHKPALIHANTCLSFMPVLVAHEMGIPAVWSIHEPTPAEHLDGFPADIQARIKAALGLADYLFFVSSDSRDAWGQYIPNGQNVSVIPKSLPPNDPPVNGQTLRGEYRCAADDLMILSVGTVCARKGQMDVIHALATMNPSELAKMVLVMVGMNNSDYAKDLANQVAQLPMRCHLIRESRTVEAMQKTRALFHVADVFVMSSRAETLPRTSQEALQSGCPVISTTAPGVGEMITDGENGLLYTAGDVHQLAQHIRKIGSLGQCFEAQKDTSYSDMIARYKTHLLALV